MSRSGSETSEHQMHMQPAAPASLARLRDAFGGVAGADGTSNSNAAIHSSNDVVGRIPPSSTEARAATAVAVTATYQFGDTSEPPNPHGTTHFQSSPIDLDRGGFANPYATSPIRTGTPNTHTDTPTTANAALPEDAGGMSGARQYFHVSPPSPTHNQHDANNNNNNNTSSNSNCNDHNNNNTDGSQPHPLFPPQFDVTHHTLSGSSSDDEHVNNTLADAPITTRMTPPPALQAMPPSPSFPEGVGEQGETYQHEQQYRSSGGNASTDSDLSPPRSPGLPMTAEEEQMARLRAYNEMSDTDGSKRGFVTDTLSTLLPNGVTHFFSRTADVVAQQSSSAVPEGVKHAASVAANTIGNGAQHIGDAIGYMPELMVNAIPNAIMSTEVKRLIFTDFSNTFRSFFHTNILSMPFVIRQAGLIGGIFLLTFVAITSEYATEAYFGAKNQMKNAHKVILYGDVPRMVWGQWYPMINLFYGITHLIGFIAFSASNSVVLLGAMGMRGGGARALGLIIPSLIAVPLVLMKNAHSQEPLSIMSNLLVFTAVILMFVDFPYAPTPPIKLWPSSATEFFVAMGVSVYAFTGIGSCIPIERGMSPRRYRKLLRVSVAIAWAILLTFGLSGFLSYGNHTCSVMTVSLQKGSLRTAVSALLFFASIMIIPQQTFPLCELSDRRLLGITRLTTYWDLKPNLMRIMYLVVSAFAAFIIPYYGLLLSISGAVGCGVVGLVVPAALDYVRRERRGLHHGRTMRFYEYLIVFGLGFYGCVVVVIGVVSGSYQLWISLQTQSTDTC